jgi:hypothetical protein
MMRCGLLMVVMLRILLDRRHILSFLFLFIASAFWKTKIPMGIS